MIQTPIAERDALITVAEASGGPSAVPSSDETLLEGMEHLHEAEQKDRGSEEEFLEDEGAEAEQGGADDELESMSPELRTLSFLVSTSISLSTATISTMQGEQKNVALNRLSLSLIAQLTSQAKLR